jgi:hypothetical protein
MLEDYLDVLKVLLGCFKSKNNNQEIHLHICNYLNVGALDTYL